MTAAMILKEKGSTVHTVSPDATLEETAKVLTGHGIGAVIVVEAANPKNPVGVLSERDIVRAIARMGASVLPRPVRDYMVSPVITCREQDSIENLMELMTGKRIRHLPVVDDDGLLVGMVSIGDVVKQKIAAAELEARALQDYIAAN